MLEFLAGLGDRLRRLRFETRCRGRRKWAMFKDGAKVMILPGKDCQITASLGWAPGRWSPECFRGKISGRRSQTRDASCGRRSILMDSPMGLKSSPSRLSVRTKYPRPRGCRQLTDHGGGGY